MKNSQKTNEQLHQDLRDALNLFINNLKELLHNGNYQVKFVSRNIDTQEINGAAVNIDGQDFVLTKQKAKVYLHLNIEMEDLLNQKLIEDYERVSIDNDINNHMQIIELLKQKKEQLFKPEPKPEEDNQDAL